MHDIWTPPNINGCHMYIRECLLVLLVPGLSQSKNAALIGGILQYIVVDILSRQLIQIIPHFTFTHNITSKGHVIKVYIIKEIFYHGMATSIPLCLWLERAPSFYSQNFSLHKCKRNQPWCHTQRSWFKGHDSFMCLVQYAICTVQRWANRLTVCNTNEKSSPHL